MTDHHHPESQVPERDRPTRKQLSYLRSLAMQTEQSFATPRTKTQASQEIKRLQRAVRNRRGEAVGRCASDVRERVAGATAIRSHEITGYGSSARWA
jgi:hypothetical protein